MLRRLERRCCQCKSASRTRIWENVVRVDIVGSEDWSKSLKFLGGLWHPDKSCKTRSEYAYVLKFCFQDELEICRKTLTTEAVTTFCAVNTQLDTHIYEGKKKHTCGAHRLLTYRYCKRSLEKKIFWSGKMSASRTIMDHPLTILIAHRIKLLLKLGCFFGYDAQLTR